MKRFVLVGLMLALLGTITSPVAVSAQDPSSGDLGTPTPIYGIEGSQLGTITIDEFIDPAPGVDPSYVPIRGYHYAAVVVTIENTASRPFEVNPTAIQVVDSEGFIAQQSFVSVIEADAPVVLEYLDALAPGTSVTGAIYVEMYNESDMERIVYSPDFQISLPVADLRSGLAASGSPASIIGPDGTEMAQATLHSMADPWEGYDEFSAPDRGSRYVMLEVEFVNMSDQVLTSTPNDFIAVDEQGIVLDPAFVTASDESLTPFDYVDLEPGASQHGYIWYQVFSDIPLIQLSWGDRFQRNVVVADLGPDAPPVPAPELQTQAATPVSDDTSTTTDIASSPECEGLVDWAITMVDNIGTSAVLVEPLREDFDNLDPQEIRDIADELRVMAQQQRDSSPPPAAEPLSELLAESYYEAMANTTDKLADAVESGNTATALIVTAEAEAIAAIFDDGAEADAIFDDLEAACPAEIDILDETAG